MKCEHNFKSEIMPIFHIKTHTRGTIYEKPHYFILNKGLNSGKPNKEPYTNSFVVLCNSEQELEDLFWISYSLWKSKFWIPHLKGSVIPFLALHVFKKEFFPKVSRLLQEYEQHQKNIKALQLLQQQETLYTKNIHLIYELRNVILMKYILKKR